MTAYASLVLGIDKLQAQLIEQKHNVINRIASHESRVMVIATCCREDPKSMPDVTDLAVLMELSVVSHFESS